MNRREFGKSAGTIAAGAIILPGALSTDTATASPSWGTWIVVYPDGPIRQTTFLSIESRIHTETIPVDCNIAGVRIAGMPHETWVFDKSYRVVKGSQIAVAYGGDSDGSVWMSFQARFPISASPWRGISATRRQS